MTTSTMPKWPERVGVSALGSQITIEEAICVATYEYGLRNAWEVRCRVAIEALRQIKADPTEYRLNHAEAAQEALAAIGELPGAWGR